MQRYRVPSSFRADKRTYIQTPQECSANKWKRLIQPNLQTQIRSIIICVTHAATSGPSNPLAVMSSQSPSDPVCPRLRATHPSPPSFIHRHQYNTHFSQQCLFDPIIQSFICLWSAAPSPEQILNYCCAFVLWQPKQLESHLVKCLCDYKSPASSFHRIIFKIQIILHPWRVFSLDEGVMWSYSLEFPHRSRTASLDSFMNRLCCLLCFFAKPWHV